MLVTLDGIYGSDIAALIAGLPACGRRLHGIVLVDDVGTVPGFVYRGLETVMGGHPCPVQNGSCEFELYDGPGYPMFFVTTSPAVVFEF